MTCQYCHKPEPDPRTQSIGCCIPGSYRNAQDRLANGWDILQVEKVMDASTAADEFEPRIKRLDQEGGRREWL